jgi:hypothetical protein
MHGDPNNPFVYQHRFNYYGSHQPWQYSYRNAGGGPGMKGSVLESVFMGNEEQVKRDIEAGKLPDLPWEYGREYYMGIQEG